jgi:hypothetical protein
MGKAATAEKAEVESAVDEAKIAVALGQEMAKQLPSMLEKLKDAQAEMLKDLGYEKTEITEELIFRSFQAMPAEKKDDLLRKHGLVPTPGFFSSITGWHNIEHLRSKGWQNKVQGAMGLLYQGAAIGLAIYLGVDWYRSRAA